MPSKSRPDPVIPDHVVLRKIGGGAYGEVWLARGVTGALRAVKVVWREDFEDERGFEREFEGILKFEPMSRDHPGLVNILHVGRSPDGASFYYYVMELGDDVRSGQDINPVEYEPRTLRADTKDAAGKRMDTATCIDVGLRLAEALDHLHERGLAHRDVKPSNVIFLNGRAKLADIGLVAARGQRTFVGTEGFVPPEGPGSAQADVYSLGKVLYEIATGKDRLDFPELPDEGPPQEERKRWLDLNRIICDICDPQISRRKISTAGELADALRRLQRGKRRRRPRLAAWVTTLVLGTFAVLGGWEALKDSPWVTGFLNPPPAPLAPKTGPGADAEPPVKMGIIRIVSSPDTAEVFDADDNRLGFTPLDQSVPVGSLAVYKIRMPGFLEELVSETVPASAASEAMIVGAVLRQFSPPEKGEEWSDHFGDRYQQLGDEHLGSDYVSKQGWIRFLKSKDKNTKDEGRSVKVSRNGKPGFAALATFTEAQAYCDWLRKAELDAGYLYSTQEMLPKMDESFDDPTIPDEDRKAGRKPFRVLVRTIPYGTVHVSSMPPGASVYLDNQFSGNTWEPLQISATPGKHKVTLVLEGYMAATEDIEVPPNGQLKVDVPLKKNRGVVFGMPKNGQPPEAWENGLGMMFLPLKEKPDELMVSIWETRVQDYSAYLVATRGKMPPENDRGPSHPIVHVSRDDAEAFCKWLTEKEAKDQLITVETRYRLPTDIEWSLMAGLQEKDDGHSPGWRDARKASVFPWGYAWPPPKGFANLADVSAAHGPKIPENRTIPGYDDGFEMTAPVGSFKGSAINGIYDLCGNVHEWVQDDYSSVAGHAKNYGVLRGGGWNSFQRENLYTGYRNAVPHDRRESIYGFRVVLERVKPATEPSSTPNP